jgi:hypothetical protein
MKQKSNSSPTKTNNFTIKDLNNSKKKEISIGDFKTTSTRMIHKFKAEMY